MWKQPGWPLPDSQDGVFLQLDSLKAKRLYYLPFQGGLLRSVPLRLQRVQHKLPITHLNVQMSATCPCACTDIVFKRSNICFAIQLQDAVQYLSSMPTR